MFLGSESPLGQRCSQAQRPAGDLENYASENRKVQSDPLGRRGRTDVAGFPNAVVLSVRSLR